tara:strand:+ start:715 stop:1173 length:459 start_codon:yes stop_codon:yes gene_type:complete
LSHHFHHHFHHPSPASRGSASRFFSKSNTKSNTKKKKTTKKSRTVARRRIPRRSAAVSDSRQSAASLFPQRFCDAFPKIPKEREIRDHIYKTLNSWGEKKEGKNLSKKKSSQKYREEEEKGQGINQSIINMAKASPEDLKALFDTQQGYALL